MVVPMNAAVHCSDGYGGHADYVIVNPMTQKVIHLVVSEKKWPYVERLVPVDQVVETTSTLIRLRCTGADLAEMQPCGARVEATEACVGGFRRA